MIIHAGVALVFTIIATTAAAADHHKMGMHSGHTSPAVTVAKAWARASIGKNGAAYFNSPSPTRAKPK